MPKIDLGAVALLPWTDLYQFFNYPETSNILVVGGFKEIDGKCYILISAKFTANSSLVFPIPSEPLEIYLHVNGVPEKRIFNGEITGNTGEIIQTGGLYVYNT